MRRRRATVRLAAGFAILALGLGGCGGNSELVCTPETIYLEAREARQLSIPDDLSPPDETESLRIPAPLTAAGTGDNEDERCLEASPAFTGND